MEEEITPKFRKCWICEDCKCFLRLKKETETIRGELEYDHSWTVIYICPRCGYRMYEFGGYDEDTYEKSKNSWQLIPDKDFKPKKTREVIYRK